MTVRTYKATQTWGKDEQRKTFTCDFLWPIGSLIELQTRLTGYGSDDGCYDYIPFEEGQILFITRYLAESMPMYIGLILDKDGEVHEYGFDREHLEECGILKNKVDNAEKS